MEEWDLGASAPTTAWGLRAQLGEVHATILRQADASLPAQAPDPRRRGVPASAAVRKAIERGLAHGRLPHVGPEATTAAQRAWLQGRRLQPPAALSAAAAKFCGARLQLLRESTGASLQDLSEITKISRRYLRAIEADDVLSLPNRVYVRGFVLAYAWAVRLDGPTVWEDYAAIYLPPGPRPADGQER